MLFKVDTLKKIKTGEVTMAFRKWKRPTVRKGGTLTTRVGQLKIIEILPIKLADIMVIDLKAAGVENIDILKNSIRKIKEGQLYKISFTLLGPDPRIALRNKDHLTASDIIRLKSKLGRLDKASIHGPWTYQVLNLIHNHPKRRAVELAESLGVDKEWLKKNIRKINSLGLTISHRIGYEVSPRGKALLNHIEVD